MPVPDAPMPDVLPEVSPGAGLSPVATPEAMGSAVGQSVGMLGEVQTRLYHDANASAVMQAHNEVDDAANKTLYDKDNGLLFKDLGEKAPPAVTQAENDYAEKVSEVRGKLTNDAQRAMFDKSMGEHGMQFRRTLAEYEHRQVTAGQNATTSAFIQNRQNDIAHNSGNPQIIAASIQQQRQALVQAYARASRQDPQALQDAVDKGQAPEALKTILANNDSQSHMIALNTQLSNGQNELARQYFEANKGALNAQDLDRATKMVRVATDQDTSRSNADDIIAAVTRGATHDDGTVDMSLITEERALNLLEQRDIKDTQIYDQTKERIVSHFRLRDQAHAAAQGQLLEDAQVYMEADGNIMHDIPANKLAEMDPRYQQAALKYQKALRTQDQPQTDADTWLDLRMRAKDPQQWDDLIQNDAPSLHKGDLSDADFRKYSNMYADVQASVSKRDTKLSQGMVADSVANSLMDTNIGKMPKGPAPGQEASAEYKAASAMRLRFMDQLHKEVGAEQLKLKRELTPDEIKTQADKLFTQTTWQVPPSWIDQNIPTPLTFLSGVTGGAVRSRIFDSTQASGPYFMAPGADKQAYSVRDIPLADRDRLATKAKKAGAPLTEQTLLEAYNREVFAAAAKAARAAP